MNGLLCNRPIGMLSTCINVVNLRNSYNVKLPKSVPKIHNYAHGISGNQNLRNGCFLAMTQVKMMKDHCLVFF